MPVSEAQKKATSKYVKSHYDRIELKVKSGSKDKISAHAAKHDKSVNAFILRAIRQAMLDDGCAPEDLPDSM